MVDKSDLQISSPDPAAVRPSWAENVRTSSPWSIETEIPLPLTSHNEYHPDNPGPPNVWDLAYVRQLHDELIGQLWVRLLSVKDNIIPTISNNPK